MYILEEWIGYLMYDIYMMSVISKKKHIFFLAQQR